MTSWSPGIFGIFNRVLHCHKQVRVNIRVRVGPNFDIKIFTNCQFGMMSWAVLIVSYAVKQVKLYGKLSDSISLLLVLVYVTKFFWWEAGHWKSMDIANDRAGSNDYGSRRSMHLDKP